jgi:hypothetical protein
MKQGALMHSTLAPALFSPRIWHSFMFCPNVFSKQCSKTQRSGRCAIQAAARALHSVSTTLQHRDEAAAKTSNVIFFSQISILGVWAEEAPYLACGQKRIETDCCRQLNVMILI